MTEAMNEYGTHSNRTQGKCVELFPMKAIYGPEDPHKPRYLTKRKLINDQSLFHYKYNFCHTNLETIRKFAFVRLCNWKSFLFKSSEYQNHTIHFRVQRKRTNQSWFKFKLESNQLNFTHNFWKNFQLNDWLNARV